MSTELALAKSINLEVDIAKNRMMEKIMENNEFQELAEVLLIDINSLIEIEIESRLLAKTLQELIELL